MSNRIPDKALVVVADGRKAVLFRRAGTGFAVSLNEERKLTPDTLHEQGPAGARPDDQTMKQTEEASFINRLSHALHDMHAHGAFKDLVLVLDPQSLGQLRGSLSKALEGTVVRTLAKDLTNHPTGDIERALSD